VEFIVKNAHPSKVNVRPTVNAFAGIDELEEVELPENPTIVVGVVVFIT
jgi:hypothetical protein